MCHIPRQSRSFPDVHAVGAVPALKTGKKIQFRPFEELLIIGNYWAEWCILGFFFLTVFRSAFLLQVEIKWGNSKAFIVTFRLEKNLRSRCGLAIIKCHPDAKYVTIDQTRSTPARFLAMRTSAAETVPIAVCHTQSSRWDQGKRELLSECHQLWFFLPE